MEASTKKNPGFGFHFHPHAIVDIQLVNLLCESVLALLLYDNRKYFIFFCRYHLWGLSGLNSSSNLLFSSHAPLGNIMNQWQTAQSTVSGTGDG